eukprot:TRINITY_DN68481_c0_g1_i1.p1 TRINITY_DN68481_c0_g1~~TRINITY_DN68481_c0_g1_i1.p1  ORF type:complete len:235 (-),score=57.30 TRINITY_DN68481_c0_g1_i1:115-789(-)
MAVPANLRTPVVLFLLALFRCGCDAKAVDERPVSNHIKYKKLKVDVVQEPPGGCQHKVKTGDKVGIIQNGYVHAAPTEGVEAIPEGFAGQRFDTSDGQVLRFTVGAGQLIQGMDKAVQKMCLGQKINAIIPPLMAYDDPSNPKNLDPEHRFLPLGTVVRYEIELVELNGKTMEIVEETKYVFLLALLPVVLIPVFTIYWFNRDSSTTKAAAGAKKDHKKKAKKG